MTVFTAVKTRFPKAMLAPKDYTFCLQEKIQVCFLALSVNDIETPLVYILDEEFKLPVPY